MKFPILSQFRDISINTKLKLPITFPTNQNDSSNPYYNTRARYQEPS